MVKHYGTFKGLVKEEESASITFTEYGKMISFV